MIHTGDCVDVMATMDADSFDAIVCDPPYSLGFMGRQWDKNLNHGPWATEALRVAKPGAHLLAFGGSRTHHRLFAAIEDAGWEIRDTLCWVTAAGFPKSLNVSQTLEAGVPEDARCVCERRSTGTTLGSQGGYRPGDGSGDGQPHQEADTARSSAPSLADARGRNRGGHRTDGPGVGPEHTLGLESSVRPSSVGSSPLAPPQSSGSRASDIAAFGKSSSMSSAVQQERRRTAFRTQRTHDSDGDSASSWVPPRGDKFPYSKCTTCGGWQVVQGFGTALKPAVEYIVLARKPLQGTVASNVQRYGTGALNIDATRIGTADGHGGGAKATSGFVNGYERDGFTASQVGRWPPNLLLTDAELFDMRNDGVVGSGADLGVSRGGNSTQIDVGSGRYNWNAGKRDTNPDGIDPGYGDTGGYARFYLVPKASRSDREPVWGDQTPVDPKPRVNVHPTAKPVDLMRHLVRLVTPPGGRILDPFLGSGTTAIAAIMEGFECVGIEREPEYVAIAEARLNGVQQGIGL